MVKLTRKLYTFKQLYNFSTNENISVEKLLTNSSNFIKNKKVPICINCKYVIIPNSINSYIINKSNKCLLFGSKDIVSGEINNTFAEICRKDNNMCGLNAKYFEEKKK